MRLATWNVNSLTARMARVLEWIDRVAPDVLCLQETKLSDDGFPHDAFAEHGYRSASHGDGGYNGVAIISRVGLEDVRHGFEEEPGFPEIERRAIAADCSGVRIWSVYVPNGRSLDSPAMAYKLAWLKGLSAAAGRDIRAGGPVALCGDFNVAPTDGDVWDPEAFRGSTHVSPAERAALSGLVEVGLTDVQPRALKGEPFTYWDYRAGNFHRGLGMRIDLVLLTETLARGVRDAYIDRDARKGQKPSDHAPVIVDIDT